MSSFKFWKKLDFVWIKYIFLSSWFGRLDILFGMEAIYWSFWFHLHVRILAPPLFISTTFTTALYSKGWRKKTNRILYMKHIDMVIFERLWREFAHLRHQWLCILKSLNYCLFWCIELILMESADFIVWVPANLLSYCGICAIVHSSRHIRSGGPN